MYQCPYDSVSICCCINTDMTLIEMLSHYTVASLFKGVGRGGGGGGGGGGPGPPNNLGGGQHTLWPPNSPPAFSFNFCVKQETRGP